MRLIYQLDGNLVLYDQKEGPNATWASGTDGRALGTVVMQRDGNLVMYDLDMGVVWKSDTHGNENANLLVQDDGLLAIYRGNIRVWKKGTPIGDGIQRSITLRNSSPINIRVKIYKVDDTFRVVTLPDGDFVLAPQSDRSWLFPPDVGQAQVVINGRYLSTVVPGQFLDHSVDDRIQLVNATRRAVTVRLFNENDILRAVTLPGGELQIPPEGQSYFEVPADVTRVAVVINGQARALAGRGERVVNRFDPHIYVRNEWDRNVKVRFYKPNDNIRVLTLPGELFQPARASSSSFRATFPRFRCGSTTYPRRLRRQTQLLCSPAPSLDASRCLSCAASAQLMPILTLDNPRLPNRGGDNP